MATSGSNPSGGNPAVIFLLLKIPLPLQEVSTGQKGAIGNFGT